MSGKYRGMQALIRQVNPHAAYIPCAVHSLNLVGQCTAACCADAISFFDFVQWLYVFFAGSTARRAILKDKLEQTSGRLTLKRLSDTRWSARFNVANALVRDYDEMLLRFMTHIQSLQEQFNHVKAHGKDLSYCENYLIDLGK